jgi:SAM-dependent methyltransferase
MSEHLKPFWNEEASRWSLTNKNPLVGWYDEHMNDTQEGEILFRGIPTKVGSLALEFGCGPGRNFIKFRDWFSRIDGVDISDEILRKLPLNLAESNTPVPNTWLIDGHSLPEVPSNTYDVVFSIICMQHISCRSWRLELYREFMRVLKPGGFFTFQMGFGPGHPISRDYFHEYGPEDLIHRDTRVEDPDALKKDLMDQGFEGFDYKLTVPCHDQHPSWIWARVQKPL